MRATPIYTIVPIYVSCARARVSWLLALGVLLGSIYNYSRKVKTAIIATRPDAHSVAELTLTRKQTDELLKRIDKLKKEYTQ